VVVPSVVLEKLLDLVLAVAAYVCATFHLVAVSSSNGQTARFSIEEWRNSSMQIIKPSMVVRNCIDEYMSHHSPHTLSKGA